MPNLQRYPKPLKPNLIKNMEDIVVFLTRKVTFTENPQMKINSKKNQIHEYLIHTWSDSGFKCTEYSCESWMPLFQGKVTWKYISPFR